MPARGFGGDCGFHVSLSQRLTTQGSVQRVHGGANGLRITGLVGGVQRFSSVQHDAVARAQGFVGLFALRGFAVEGIVNRFAEGTYTGSFFAASISAFNVEIFASIAGAGSGSNGGLLKFAGFL